MSQEPATVTDVSRPVETDSTLETETDALAHEPEPVDAGPGASEMGFAVRFGSGFAAGMLVGGLVGVLFNSLALAMFGGFILGTLVGTVLAARS